MTELPPFPRDPADVKAWVESLNDNAFTTVAQQVLGGGLTARAAQRLMAELDSGNRSIDLPEPPDEPSLLTLTIELRGSKPRIWRRLAMPGDLTLDTVHVLFQAAMGWTDSHLHRFQPSTGRGQSYFITEFDEEEGDEGTREEGVRLDQVLQAPGDRLTYLYDFGDDWEHRVTLEAVGPLTPENRQPRCLGGARACPPEDVGGIYGHQQIAAWLRDGAPGDRVPEPFDDAEDAIGWLPLDYDPDAFDAAQATEAMQVASAGEHVSWDSLPEPLLALIQAMHGDGWVKALAWLAALGPREAVHLPEAELNVAARPWLALLDAVGTGVKLTAAGYLPPTLVVQIAEATGLTQWWTGKLNREDAVWPVAVTRQAAQEAGLLRKAKGTLAPTARARAAAGQPDALVAAVLGRLPVGKGFEAEAGWLVLLGLAAGAAGADLYEGVASMLNDRGWRTDDSSIKLFHARRGALPTVGPLTLMAGGPQTPDTELVARLARAALFGVARQG